jgi:hypothetical protein
VYDRSLYINFIYHFSNIYHSAFFIMPAKKASVRPAKKASVRPAKKASVRPAKKASVRPAKKASTRRSPSPKRVKKTAAFKPCSPGKERNPLTNRCRKVVAKRSPSPAKPAKSRSPSPAKPAKSRSPSPAAAKPAKRYAKYRAEVTLEVFKVTPSAPLGMIHVDIDDTPGLRAQARAVYIQQLIKQTKGYTIYSVRYRGTMEGGNAVFYVTWNGGKMDKPLYIMKDVHFYFKGQKYELTTLVPEEYMD